MFFGPGWITKIAMQHESLLIAALTGGIASGKSTVARMFADLGAHIIDTDLIARQVVEPGGEGLAQVAEAFGPRCLTPLGELDRAALREKIFNDSEARETLNRILHPLIRAEVKRRLSEISISNPGGVALVDVPLLFETGWYTRYEIRILVYVPPQVQITRLMARDRITKAQAEKALAAQMPIDEKRKKATFLVDNQGTLEETLNRVRTVWYKLLEEAARGRQ